MKYNNHRRNCKEFLPFNPTEGDNFLASDDIPSDNEEEDVKISKNLEFFLRKPFCCK